MFSKSRLYEEDLALVSTTFVDWDVIAGKTFFITGATGLIGSTLVDTLMYHNRTHDTGIKVIALTRNIEAARHRFDIFKDDPLLEFLQGDVAHRIEISQSVDYIVNLASNTHPGLYASRPIETIESIISGAKNVLDLAVKKEATRVIQASSVEVYGENKGDVERFTEEYCGYIDCNTLRAGYPEGKRLAESMSQAYITEKNIDVVSARLGRVYGAPTLSSDMKATTQFIRNAVRGEDIVLKSKGEQEYSCIYVADVVSALLMMATRAKCGEAYNISSDEVKSFRDLAGILAGLNDKEVVFDIQDHKGASVVQRALMDSSKLKRMGWSAQYDLSHGLSRTVEILRSDDGA